MPLKVWQNTVLTMNACASTRCRLSRTAWAGYAHTPANETMSTRRLMKQPTDKNGGTNMEGQWRKSHHQTKWCVLLEWTICEQSVIILKTDTSWSSYARQFVKLHCFLFANLRLTESCQSDTRLKFCGTCQWSTNQNCSRIHWWRMVRLPRLLKTRWRSQRRRSLTMVLLLQSSRWFGKSASLGWDKREELAIFFQLKYMSFKWANIITGMSHWTSKLELMTTCIMTYNYACTWSSNFWGYFVRDVGVTRGHSFELFKKRVSLDVGRYKFGSKVCNEWNVLTEDVVSAGLLNTFKARLDHHLMNVRGVGLNILCFPLLPSMSCLGWKDGKRWTVNNTAEIV